MTDKKEKACGNPECGISTGICGSITAGTGKLDFNGYWEFPCYICPKKFEHREQSSRGSEASYLNDHQEVQMPLFNQEEPDHDPWMDEPLTEEEEASMVKAMKEFEAGETEEW